jgi:hypothetical protein
MDIVEQHEMKLEATHPTGAQEWSCPTCGRRFLVQWSPTFNMVILEPGDPKAAHNGSTGGLRIGSVQVTSSEDASSEDIGSSSWNDWLEDLDMDNL